MWCFRLGNVDDAVDVEGYLLRVGAPMFVVEAVGVFAVFFCGKGVVAPRYSALVDFVGVGGCLDLRAASVSAALLARKRRHIPLAYPEVNLQVPTAPEFPIADLKGDGHLVVLVQGLVETLALVGLHLDAVRRNKGQQAARYSECRERREQHACDCRGCALGRVSYRGESRVVVSTVYWVAPSYTHGDASCCPQS